MSKKCSCGKKHHNHNHDHKKPHHDDKSGWLRDLILDSCDSKHRGLLEGLLFGRHHDCHDHCHDHKPKPPFPPAPVNCEGCACAQFAMAEEGDEFLILLEGGEVFLNLGPGQAEPQATVFTFVDFDPDTCCVTFEFDEEPVASGEIIFDCRCICAIVPLNGNGTPPTNGL